ncbi:MAG: hypothetical protein AAGG56_15545 [Pseudomonadota bacterium]
MISPSAAVELRPSKQNATTVLEGAMFHLLEQAVLGNWIATFRMGGAGCAAVWLRHPALRR